VATDRLKSDGCDGFSHMEVFARTRTHEEYPHKLQPVTSVTEGIFADRRVTCQTCVRLWRTPAGAHACTDHRRAGLTTRELALDFTHLAQNCPSWSAKP